GGVPRSRRLHHQHLLLQQHRQPVGGPHLGRPLGCQGSHGRLLLHPRRGRADAFLDIGTVAFLPVRRRLRSRVRRRDVSLPGGQPSVLWHGPSADRLRSPEHGLWPGHGPGRSGWQHPLRRIQLLQPGLGSVDRRQSGRNGRHLHHGVHQTGAHPRLGKIPTPRGPNPRASGL
ncbi:uncharacterized protein METZ01_LOCUS344107, partial [marine metagenome]